ncbi:response regulator [Methylobacter psychrophilus]|uniref:response regulator n=1 Tax=Methylobacter psychrophilus TaxID=96941 RepID=UPI0021D4EF85|nr:HD domain-containing phosphohydrolase [Methylobacter psychrophilus]
MNTYSTHIATLLLVDDEPLNLRLLQTLLKTDGYETLSAERGAEALALAEERQPDLILLDIMMPEMDGFEVARLLKTNPHTNHIPIIIVTSLDDRASRLKALEMGANEFINKPVDRAELSIRVKNMLRLKEYTDYLADHNHLLEELVAKRTSQLTESYHETIFIMTSAAESKDTDTGLHVIRISYYCRALAKYLGMDAEFQDCIFYASPMHDIGKIGIPDHILLKPGSFEPDEWEIMKTHSAQGAKILECGNSPYLRMGAEIALNHHERWDGGGYPNGKRGQEIPFSSRLMNISDQYDALRSKRPYKPHFDHNKAMQIITEGDGRTMPGHFDPDVLAAFKACAEIFRGIYAEHTQ